MNERAKTPLVVFLLGALLGSGLTLALARHHRRHKPDPERLARKLTRELSLRDDQQKTVRAAIDDGAAKLESLRKETAGRFERIRADTRADIRKLLDPEQQAKFDALAQRWDRRRQGAPAP